MTLALDGIEGKAKGNSMPSQNLDNIQRNEQKLNNYTEEYKVSKLIGVMKSRDKILKRFNDLGQEKLL